MRAKEADCITTIIQAAKLAGWRVHHSRPGRMQSGRWSTPIQGDAGLPDLILVRPPRLMFVETKRRPYKVAPEQHEWLSQLSACGVETRIVWVPEQQDAFIAELMKR